MVVYCFICKNELFNVGICWCGGVSNQIQFVVFQMFSVVNVGVINMQVISNNIVINVSFVEDCVCQVRFMIGNIWYCVVQMGGKGNFCVEIGFCFF